MKNTLQPLKVFRNLFLIDFFFTSASDSTCDLLGLTAPDTASLLVNPVSSLGMLRDIYLLICVIIDIDAAVPAPFLLHYITAVINQNQTSGLIIRNHYEHLSLRFV